MGQYKMNNFWDKNRSPIKKQSKAVACIPCMLVYYVPDLILFIISLIFHFEILEKCFSSSGEATIACKNLTTARDVSAVLTLFAFLGRIVQCVSCIAEQRSRASQRNAVDNFRF